MPRGRERPICKFPECGRPHKARGWCYGHYTQWKAGKEMKPLWLGRQRNTGICKFPDCGQPPRMKRFSTPSRFCPYIDQNS